ncbi:hypothetical protein JHD53_01970 [Peptacetobacter hiranonis]|uniref:hypothetical protein n=1 Tax=Peptacetobacter hiranonis TaxID=89152 RepID=UPI0019170EA3|nr:hypothetical protein [Peptacetobacter hiranonis]QQQ86887.1 hypothetical protein JHD53_01970 [Peptacetobacter hiranonis]
MNNPTIVIAHKIKGRIRIKLSHPLRNGEELMKNLVKKDEIYKANYTDITKSILIEYNPYRISEDEVIIRVIALYSKSYDMIPIRLIYESKKKNLPPMACYSLAMLGIGGISKYITMNQQISDFINWAVVGTTIGAIGEHAYNEVNERGYFDPEVVSVMYLINSVTKGEFLLPSAVTWLTTFGRHLIELSYGGLMISVREFKNRDGNKYFDVSVKTDNELSKGAGMIRVFLERFIELERNSMGKSFMVSDRGMTGYSGRLYSDGIGDNSYIGMDTRSLKLYKDAIK